MDHVGQVAQRRTDPLPRGRRGGLALLASEAASEAAGSDIVRSEERSPPPVGRREAQAPPREPADLALSILALLEGRVAEEVSAAAPIAAAAAGRRVLGTIDGFSFLPLLLHSAFVEAGGGCGIRAASGVVERRWHGHTRLTRRARRKRGREGRQKGGIDKFIFETKIERLCEKCGCHSINVL